VLSLLGTGITLALRDISAYFKCNMGKCGSVVFKALCYEPEGHGFDTDEVIF
jgi:hypothetical protein